MSIFASEQALDSYQDKQMFQVVNEAYFGRTPGINKVYNAFCDWRDKYKNNRIIGKGNVSAMNDKLLRYFRKTVEEQFGFSTVTIWLCQSDSRNMMSTIPAFGVGPDKVIVTKEGYKYKEDAQAAGIFIMNAGLIFDSSFSNEECFGIFLHEVGHAFQNSLNGMMISIRWATNLFTIGKLILSALNMKILKTGMYSLSILMSSSGINRVTSYLVNSVIIDNKVLSYIVSSYSYLASIVSSIINTAKLIPSFMILPFAFMIEGLKSLTNLVINPVGSFYGYYGERFADGFPASYGFSLQAAIAIDKLDSTQLGLFGEALNQFPILANIYNAMCLPGIMLMSVGDEHPLPPTRAYSILNDLKEDLNDPSLDPKLKTKLKNEIYEYEKSMNLYFEEESKIGNSQIARSIVYRFIYEKCKGGLKFKVFSGFGKINFRRITNNTANKIRNSNRSYKESADFINNTKII